MAELPFGAYNAGWGSKRRQELADEMRKYLVVDANYEVADLWARIRHERKAVGREIAQGDAWIAATAQWLVCPVVTHNRRDFDGVTGLEVITEPD